MKTVFLLTISSLLISTGLTWASDQVGTITGLEGTVKLFYNPSKTLPKDSADATPRALFEGEYFYVRDAKMGDRVEHGNILRTAPSAKARVIFDNGDQYNVGPATAYRVFWKTDSKDAQSKIDLMYGKLRGIVTKGGPRSKLLIRTKTAAMGVRGTDFFIATDSAENGGGTEVSIIRGSVEVTPEKKGAKPIEVKAGFSAEVLAKAELRKTTQEDLTAIQKSSEVKAPEAAQTKEAPAEIKALEKKSVEAVIADVKATDPKLFAELQAKPMTSTDEINQLAVQKIYKEAPKAPVKRKPFKSEMEDLEGGSYEKFFKPAK